MAGFTKFIQHIQQVQHIQQHQLVHTGGNLPATSTDAVNGLSNLMTNPDAGTFGQRRGTKVPDSRSLGVAVAQHSRLPWPNLRFVGNTRPRTT